MNDNAKKWVAALRSGEFKQTKEVLKNSRGYCCFGVACEIYQREVGGLHVVRPVSHDIVVFNGHTAVAPEPVLGWLGLQNRCGAFGTASGRQLLTRMNDRGATFSEIADLIESEPEGLFVHSASAKPDEMNPSEVSS